VPHAREPKYVKTARKRSSGGPAKKNEKTHAGRAGLSREKREREERESESSRPSAKVVESHVLTGEYTFVNSRAGAAVSVDCRAREEQKKHRAPRESSFLSRKCSRVFLFIGTFALEWDLFLYLSLPHRLTHTHTHTHKLPSLATERNKRA
jgi:hypothetical protein